MKSSIVYPITFKQILWLNQCGGLGIFDIFVENGKIGVYMFSGSKKEYKFVEIPNDNELLLKGRIRGNQDYPSIFNYVIKYDGL